MTVNEFCSKVYLPNAVAHFGWETPKYYRKLPYYGWYALSKTEDITFNAIDLFAFNNPQELRTDDLILMSRCYRYYVQEHPDLLEVPIKYSETVEKELVNDYCLLRANERFWKAARYNALENGFNYNAKNWRLPDLFNSLGMTKFINAGIGVTNYKIINSREFAVLKLHNRHCNKLLIPTYFAPNGKIASLEVFKLGDLTEREKIYRNSEPGWYGRIGGAIVGSLRDLMTIDGCTWTPAIVPWAADKVLSLHQSLQPVQCVEIWTNQDNIVTNIDPLSLIKSTNLAEQLKDSIGKLTIQQMKKLEKTTGCELQKAWVASKTSEISIGGIRFIKNNNRYYYFRGNKSIEYTNFTLELSKIKKEGEDFYQYGNLSKDEDTVAFKIKRAAFVTQQALLKALTNVMLEAGIGTPSVAPNLKHYITNVVDAFNPENAIEKPKPASVEPKQTVIDLEL